MKKPVLQLAANLYLKNAEVLNQVEIVTNGFRVYILPEIFKLKKPCKRCPKAGCKNCPVKLKGASSAK